MRDFVYFNPVKVIFGRDKSAGIGEIVKPFGKKALLVYGKESIKKSGLHSLIIEKLNQNGIEVIEHGGVKPNPTLLHTREGVQKAKLGGVEVILAVGGGSAMDEAKAIAVGAANDFDVWDIFSKGVKPQTALPVVTIPTLAATGSEMNGNLVLTNEETNEKIAVYSPACFPKVSVLDPVLTLSVPRNHTAYGVADIFSHILEPYFNGKEDEHSTVQDNIAEGLFLSLMESSGRLMNDLNSYTARAEVQWISSLALCGIAAMGRGGVKFENHFIAHSISALFDVPHGAALSVVMPGWMKWAAGRDTAKFARFGERVMGFTRGGEETATALIGIEKTREWLVSIGAPVTLREINISTEDIPRIVENFLPAAQKAGYDDLTEKAVTEILHSCY